ncbi:MAG: GDP-mannose 4,6-dehydratase [Candidatus Omnitrophica bacterium]|nr:GDP-mannose 4,6-dehydratase [Candidatus Omnitrophota bacterium]
MRPVKVVVVGSNSFSGSDFIDLLLEKGSYQAAGVSRSPEKSEIFLPYKKRSGSDFQFHQMDLNRDMPRLLNFLDSFAPDFIVNFACQSEVAPSWENPDHWFETNCVAFSKLVNHLRGKNYLKRYVHISTPEVYGNAAGSLNENTPLNPSTPYAVSRAAQDQLLKIYRERFSFPVVTVRSANVFGAHQQLWKIIPRSVIHIESGRKIPLEGGGKARRSFIHIRDVSEGELLAMEKGQNGAVYHFSTETTQPVKEVVETVCRQMGTTLARAAEIVGDRVGQDTAYPLDTGRSRRELGWRARVGLEEGVREVIAWVRSHWNAIQNEPLEYVHRS